VLEHQEKSASLNSSYQAEFKARYCTGITLQTSSP